MNTTTTPQPSMPAEPVRHPPEVIGEAQTRADTIREQIASLGIVPSCYERTIIVLDDALACAEADLAYLRRKYVDIQRENSDWKTLTGWGGTPAHIEAFIKGQQERIRAAQDAENDLTVERQRREKAELELAEARKANDMLLEALESCSVFVTPLERLKGWNEYKEDAAQKRRAVLDAARDAGKENT